MFEIKNPVLKALVQKHLSFGNLIINDVPLDDAGNVAVKLEKQRKDNKKQRLYYQLNLVSLENVKKSRPMLMWQSHSNDGKSVSWRDISPLVAQKIGAGGSFPGTIWNAELKAEYDIPYIDSADNQEKVRKVNKISLYLPDETTAEEVIMAEFRRIGIIATEPQESGASATNARAIANGQGEETPEEEKETV